MQFPLRSQFSDRDAHLEAMSQWIAASDDAYQSLLKMYRQTKPSDTKPEWLTFYNEKSDYHVRHVAFNMTPNKIRLSAALNFLSTNALQGNLTIVELCYGTLDPEAGWSCYAKLK